MKIISIKFLNLNSLKGRHEIHFNQPPFSESGLFAITGPTGAGKTTILDAITVALYGRVHRHNKDVFEIMTRHTGECYAEIEFEVKEQLYRSKWMLKRSRGKAEGALQQQKMELINADTDEVIIAHPLQAVRDAIVELCGLDYNQFLRSVMLSQGDFTRFLKADENERSELLEKITDTGIYSEISKAAYEKARQERSVLEQLSGKLSEVTLLRAEERLAYTEELAGLLVREAAIKKEELALRTQLEWLKNLGKLELRQQQLQKNLYADELFYQSHREAFSRLGFHQQAMVYRPALAEIKTIESQLQTFSIDLKELELSLPFYITESNETKIALEQAKNQLVATRKILTDHEPVFEEILKKDMFIVQAKVAVEKTTAELEKANTDYHTAQNSKISLTAELKNIQEKIFLLSGWLKENEGDAKLEKEIVVLQQYMQQKERLTLKSGSMMNREDKYKAEIKQGNISAEVLLKSITTQDDVLLEQQHTLADFNLQLTTMLSGKTTEDLEQELTIFPPLINISEQQSRLSVAYQKGQSSLDKVKKDLDNYALDFQSVKTILEQLSGQHTDAAELLKTFQDIYELEVKVQNYDQDRLALAPEKPCPLCGSIHHPYLENHYTVRVNETLERRNRQQEKLQEIRILLDQQQQVFNKLNYQIEAGTQTRTLAELELSTVLKEFEDNNAHLPKGLEIDRPDIITAVIAKKKVQQENLLQQLRAARSLQQQIVTHEQMIRQQREVISNSRNQLEQLKLSLAFGMKQLEELSQELLTTEKELKNIDQESMHLLLPFKLIYDTAEPGAVLQTMKERLLGYNASVQQFNNLQPELREKETDIKNITAAIHTKKELLDNLTIQQQKNSKELLQLQEERAIAFADKDPKEEKEKLSKQLENLGRQGDQLQLLMQEKQEQLRIAEARKVMINNSIHTSTLLLEAQQQKLLIDIQAIGLTSVSALNESYLEDEEAADLLLLQQESMQKIASDKSMIAALEKELIQEKQLALTEEPEEELSLQLQQRDVDLSALMEHKGKVGEVLNQDDQLRMKHKEVAEQLESQQREYDRFHKLSVLIGSADGKKFSRFAQGLTLARLTELANRHLLQLSDRYRILKSAEKDLDLQIIDAYQADVIRPMSTLSGGESFLVSLALALGLSDLASRKVQINSLFIDEGFGTLDAETLDVAITALENLQANGKSIGVISHVEALKERIGTQIQVTKQPGGSSRINLQSYGNLVGFG